MAILERNTDTTEQNIAGLILPLRKFTRTDYYSLAEAGVLVPDERTELLDGIIYIKGEPKGKSPIGAAHIYCVNRLANLLCQAGISDSEVLLNASVALDDISEPEPDILLVRGSMSNYSKVIPSYRDVLLAVEVSYSTLAMDMTNKAAAYARSAIADYWIVNLAAREVIMHRDPRPESGYGSITNVSESGSVSSLLKPEYVIKVSDILP